MTTRGSGEHPHVPETFRHYPITIIYIVLAITLVLALLIWDRLDGPAHAVCILQTAITQGETR